MVENATGAARVVIPTTVGQLAAAAQHVGAGPALVMVGEVYANVSTNEITKLSTNVSTAGLAMLAVQKKYLSI